MDKETNIVKKGFKDYFIENPKISFTILGVIIASIIVIIFMIGFKNYNLSQNKTTKIGFEDIGELVTQVAYCTEVSSTEDVVEFFGMKMPFTQSKYIYSYDIAIKAGFDFEEIEWEEKREKIEVKLPEAKILSSEIILDSFKIYHEEESIFNEVTMTENNKSMQQLKENAEKDSIGNGMLKEARANAESILKVFFENEYDLDKYEIVFKDK